MLLHVFVVSVCLANVAARSISESEGDEMNYSSPEENLRTMTDRYYAVADPVNADGCSPNPCRYDGTCSVQNGKITCSCRGNYGGERCEKYLCDPNPCNDNGICIIKDGKQTCDCNPNYAGDNCEFNVCHPNPCKNEGKCVEKNGEATCVCSSTYTGDTCEINVCKVNPCVAGTCINRNGIATCVCPNDRLGYKCEIDYCTPNPCQNGGKCDFWYTGYSNVYKRVCKCSSIRYTGQLCELALCKDNKECQNGGTCEIRGNAKICVCKDGTTGSSCEIVPGCDRKDCEDNATCSYDIATENVFCKCNDGTRIYDEKEEACKVTCEGNKECQNGGKCQKRGTAKICVCKEGTKGNSCEIVPGCHGKDCGDYATCSYDAVTENVFCKCNDGTRIYDEKEEACKVICKDNKECQNGGKCQKRGTEKICVCKEGTKGNSCEIVPGCDRKDCGDDATCSYDIATENVFCKCNDGTRIYDEKEEVCKDGCSPNPCRYNGTCSVRNGKIICSCRGNYGGDRCEKYLCDPDPCNDHGICIIKDGKQTCDCNQPYAGDNCEFNVCHPDPCKNKGKCIEENGKPTCNCEDPYTGDICEINICKVNPCVAGRCTGRTGKPTCECPSDRLGYKCEIDRCEPNPCQNDGQCNFLKNGDLNCNCSSLYTGKLCETAITETTERTLTTIIKDRNTTVTAVATPDLLTSISTETSTPSTLQTEIQNETSISMAEFSTVNITTVGESSRSPSWNTTVENTSYEASSTVSETLPTARDPCSLNPCRNGGMCKTEGGEILCFCVSPYNGKFCEMDPCTSNACMNGGHCKINGTTFRCDCHKPFSGRLCEKDPCSDHPCQNGGTCFVVGNSFQCICQDPYVGNNCESNPCMWHLCKNGGICKVENNAAKCFCKEPFAGEFCDSRTDPCMWYPCKNGGICKFENNAPKCFCKEPFTGEFCDSRAETDVTSIILAVMASLLVAVLIFVAGMFCRRIQVLKTNQG